MRVMSIRGSHFEMRRWRDLPRSCVAGSLHVVQVSRFEWRICFRYKDGDAYDVEVCDYH